MEDLSHWDFAESFSGDEAAYLILGKTPNPSYQDSEVKKTAVVLHRLSNDYRAAGGALLGLLVKSEPCIELVLQGSLRSELMEAAFISAQRCKEWDAEMAEIEFDGWLASNDSRFVHQTFSRTELARWLKATGLKSVYQFDIGGAGDTELEPTQPQSRWPWGDYHTENLGHIESAIKKFWVNFDPSDNTTAPTNETVIAWLKERGLSENLAKSIASIIRADGLPTGKRT